MTVVPAVVTATLLPPDCRVTAPAVPFVLPMVVVKPPTSAVLMSTDVSVAVTLPPSVTFNVAALFDKPTLALAPERFVEVEPVIVLVAPVIVLTEVPALPIVFTESTVATPMLLVFASTLFVPVVAFAVMLLTPLRPVADKVFEPLAALALNVFDPVVAVIVLPVLPVNWFCCVAFRTLLVPAVNVLVVVDWIDVEVLSPLPIVIAVFVTPPTSVPVT